jgi:hypothetical protein
MFDRLTAPVALAVGRGLAMSALPNAPVVADKRRRPRRERRRLRGFAERLVAPRSRPQGTQLEKEAPCGT